MKLILLLFTIFTTGNLRINHDCAEADREYGNWDTSIYLDHSNLVTRLCNYYPLSSSIQSSKKLRYETHSTIRDRPDFQFDNFSTGEIINLQSNKCVQLGGDMVMQCMTMYDRTNTKNNSWNSKFRYTGRINQYISPSVYPAYLYPCGKGCRPDDLQRWIATSK